MRTNARSCGCSDFSRTALVRHAVAEAGRGLPVIEPGMPLPPGTGLSRRSFLSRSLGLALSVYGAGMLSPRALDEGILAARAADPAGRILVSIYLSGGYDSLSMLYPYADPDYRRLRPKLALPEDAGPPFGEDDRLRWHPALQPLVELHEHGKVATVQQIGLPSPDGSHFATLARLQAGAMSTKLNTGWLGRYLDMAGSDDNPLQGVSFGALDPILAPSGTKPVATLGGATFQLPVPHVYGKVEARMLEALTELGSAAGPDPGRQLAGTVMTQSRRLVEQMAPFGDGSGITSPVQYPDGNGDTFPSTLAGLAAMIDAGLPLRCVAMTGPGLYDTHDSQEDYLGPGLELAFGSIAAFQRDLEARGLADRVCTVVWSEFGRRPEENGSNGTDHGAAGVAFVVGTRVRGQLIGEYTGLKDLDEYGNLKTVVDFRSVFCALLEQWFGADAGPIIPDAANFPRPELLS
jgi:uncharacterized protein (DUF1501 family)